MVLIFYRGEWRPFCVNHLEDINTVLPELNEMGVQVMAISPEDIPELAVIERYGIRRDEKLPHPAVVVIDKEGIVQWFYVGENYKERPSASQLMPVVDRLPSSSLKR